MTTLFWINSQVKIISSLLNDSVQGAKLDRKLAHVSPYLVVHRTPRIWMSSWLNHLSNMARMLKQDASQILWSPNLGLGATTFSYYPKPRQKWDRRHTEIIPSGPEEEGSHRSGWLDHEFWRGGTRRFDGGSGSDGHEYSDGSSRYLALGGRIQRMHLRRGPSISESRNISWTRRSFQVRHTLLRIMRSVIRTSSQTW